MFSLFYKYFLKYVTNRFCFPHKTVLFPVNFLHLTAIFFPSIEGNTLHLNRVQLFSLLGFSLPGFTPHYSQSTRSV